MKKEGEIERDWTEMEMGDERERHCIEWSWRTGTGQMKTVIWN